jgi:hypothetical protein
MKKNIKDLQIEILNELIKHSKLINKFNKSNDVNSLIKEYEMQKKNNEKFIEKIINDQIVIQNELDKIIKTIK